MSNTPGQTNGLSLPEAENKIYTYFGETCVF